jgi:uncharacterized protein YdaU (DUF1376 family)
MATEIETNQLTKNADKVRMIIKKQTIKQANKRTNQQTNKQTNKQANERTNQRTDETTNQPTRQIEKANTQAMNSLDRSQCATALFLLSDCQGKPNGNLVPPT